MSERSNSKKLTMPVQPKVVVRRSSSKKPVVVTAAMKELMHQSENQV
jgi:hypothetical protein